MFEIFGVLDSSNIIIQSVGIILFVVVVLSFSIKQFIELDSLSEFDKLLLPKQKVKWYDLLHFLYLCMIFGLGIVGLAIGAALLSSFIFAKIVLGAFSLLSIYAPFLIIIGLLGLSAYKSILIPLLNKFVFRKKRLSFSIAKYTNIIENLLMVNFFSIYLATIFVTADYVSKAELVRLEWEVLGHYALILFIVSFLQMSMFLIHRQAYRYFEVNANNKYTYRLVGTVSPAILANLTILYASEKNVLVLGNKGEEDSTELYVYYIQEDKLLQYIKEKATK